MEWGSPMSEKRDGKLVMLGYILMKIFVADGFPLPNEWNIVHSLALNEEAQMICGADRENFRIQCFNSNTGEFLRQIRVEKDQNIGAIYAIEFAPNANGLFTIDNITNL
jgi:peptidylamidoglycolate lyase